MIDANIVELARAAVRRAGGERIVPHAGRSDEELIDRLAG